MGKDGAVMVQTLSTKEATIPKAEWDEKRFGYACISPEDYGSLKAALEKLCSEMPKLCDYQTEERMKLFFRRLERRKEKRENPINGSVPASVFKPCGICNLAHSFR